MKLVYTHEHLFMVGNVRNFLDGAGIAFVVKNEYAQGAVGELPAHDCWPQIWVSEAQYQKALAVIECLFKDRYQTHWRCPKCQEANEPSFDVCWQCQTARD